MRTEPEKVSGVLKTVLSERGYLSFCYENDVVENWKDIVGKKISEVTVCVRVENGILYVRVPSSSWRQELIFFKREILQKIKKKTKCKTISDIKFY